jgi:hypothetical protein
MYSTITEEAERSRKYQKRRRAVSGIATYFRLLSGTLIVMVSLRMVVLTSEAYAMVSSTRSSNEELLSLCQNGIANDSPHMRTACMQARVEHASPAIFRALSSATYAFCAEIYHIAFAPLHAIGLAGMISIVSALPWMSTLRNAFGWNTVGQVTAPLASYALGLNSNRSNENAEHAIYVLHNGERSDGITTNSMSRRRMLAPPIGFDETDGCL